MPIGTSLVQAVGRAARAYVRYAPGTALKPFLVRQVVEPALRSRPFPFVIETVDGVVVGGSTHDMIQRYLYVFGVWEPDITAWMRPRLRPGRTLIDVGANVGYFTLLGSRLVGPSGRVVAVEALPETYVQLHENVRRNDADNVRLLNVAAAERTGRVMLFGGERHNSGTTTSLPSQELEALAEVDAIPLAEVLTDDEVSTARIIKIDVEGAELEVLRGLAPVLDETPDDLELVVEISPGDLRAADQDPQEPLRLMASYGFVAYRVDNDYRLVRYLDRGPPRPPRRFTGPLDERMDLVFSRTDAPVLP